jgi:hypothetical protein
MGNISNLWYLKDSGGDWASTKCALDDCYSIPFIPSEDNNLYLQADIPGGYGATEVWLTDMDGNKLQELLAMTEWKIITGAGMNRLIFRVPQDTYACVGWDDEQMECIADLMWAALPASHLILLNNYVNGLHNTHVFLQIGGIWYDIDGPLPAGYEKAGPTKIKIPCNTRYESLAWSATSNVGSAGAPWPYNGVPWITSTVTIHTPLDCFRFEVPLIDESGTVTAALLSEPFHCPACEETVKISSDYCMARTDIFGTFIFNTAGFGNTHYGGLQKALNDFRIQAVLKKLPSELKQDRNVRCNNFKSRITKKYKLQGAMTDFPDYMVNIIESIFAGKRIFIEGEEYIADAETIFIERNIAGRSMKQLDIILTKCEQGIVFDCGNCHTPTCADNPVTGFMLVLAAPDIDPGNYGVDRTYVYAEIMFLSGGVTPYTIDGWYNSSGSPNSDYEVFDDSRHFNIFRRDDLTGYSPGGMSVIAYVTDARGCRYMVGNTVDREDFTCVQYDGHFDADHLGTGLVKIDNISPSYSEYSILIDNVMWATGLTSHPHIVGPLASGLHKITLFIKCADGTVNIIGPLRITI